MFMWPEEIHDSSVKGPEAANPVIDEENYLIW
jgi:hypothetical protein